MVRTLPDAAFRAALETSAAHPHPRHAARHHRHRDLSWLTGHAWADRTADLLQCLWRTHVARTGPAAAPSWNATSPTGPDSSPPAAGPAPSTR
ncbi:hypothetical protein O1L55_31150 [Streptomyces albulus]|nr:hypothetical protein [Streptomyces noursei]